MSIESLGVLVVQIVIGAIVGKIAFKQLESLDNVNSKRFQFYLSDLVTFGLQIGMMLFVLTAGKPPLGWDMVAIGLFTLIWSWAIGVYLLNRKGIKQPFFRLILLVFAFPLTYGAGYWIYGPLIYWRIYCVIRGIRIDDVHHLENEVILFAALPPAPSIFIAHFTANYVARRENVKSINLYDAYLNTELPKGDSTGQIQDK